MSVQNHLAEEIYHTGNFEYLMGNVGVAIVAYSHCLVLYKSLHNYLQVLKVSLKLVTCYLSLGNRFSAKTILLDLDSSLEQYNVQEQRTIVKYLGDIYFEEDNFAKAERYYKQLLNGYHQEDPQIVVQVLVRLARLEAFISNYNLALDYYQQALTVAKDRKTISQLIKEMEKLTKSIQ